MVKIYKDEDELLAMREELLDLFQGLASSFRAAHPHDNAAPIVLALITLEMGLKANLALEQDPRKVMETVVDFMNTQEIAANVHVEVVKVTTH